MKRYLNPSRYIYVDVLILLCLICVLNSVFISIEVLNEIELIGVSGTNFFETPSYYFHRISELNIKGFLIDVVWYLIFYILLELICKAFSLIEIIAKIIGKPLELNIKSLNKFSALLLLLLCGKFIVFLISSLF